MGNRRSRISNVSGVLSTPAAANINFDVDDRIDNDSTASTVSTRFDANGNTKVPDLNGDGNPDSGYTYIYDAENRLISASDGSKTVTMSYDADGNRVKRVVTGTGAGTTYYIVDDQNPTGYPQVFEERLTAAGSPSTWYIYGLDLILQDRGNIAGNSTKRYYGYDGLGSARYLTDENGTIRDSYVYDAFGILTSSSGITVNNYLFTGEQWDPDLGLYYLRARYYHPDTGRFWTSDTFEGRQTDPLSLHKYVYASDDPVNRIDPSGYSSLFTRGTSLFKYTKDFGDEAHRQIQSEYQTENPGAIVGSTTGILGPLKPDLFNPITKTYGEIKPLSVSGIASGISQMGAYDAYYGLIRGYSHELWR